MSDDSTLRTWRRLCYARSVVGLESFTAPILILFYLQYCGYSFKDYGLLLSTIAVVMWLLEVPTGALADRFGRKRCLIAGNLLYTCAMAGLLLFRRDMPIVLLALLFAMGASFASGTFQSMMYQVFQEANRTVEFHSTTARGTSLSLFGGALAAIVGGWLGDRSLMLPMLVDIGVLLAVTLLLAMVLVEPAAHTQGPGLRPGFRDIIVTGVKQATATRAMVVLIICAAVTFACVRAGLNFYQPLLSEAGASLTQLGLYFAGFSLFSAWVAHWFGRSGKGALDGLIPVFLMGGALGLAAIILAYAQSPQLVPVVLAILCHQAARGIFPSYFSYAINQRVPADSASRTTVLSVASLVKAIVLAGVLGAVGFLSEGVGYAMAFVLLSGLSALILIFLFAYGGRVHAASARAVPAVRD